MLNFITGRAGTGKTALIRETIADIAASSGQEMVVIVPEQQTVAWETALSEMLPVSVNLRLEITNFTRLANSVFREYGGLADTLVDEGVRSLLIWRAMVSVWDQMQVYNHADGREDRNISVLMQAVDELKNSGVSPEDAEIALLSLEKSAEEEGKPVLSPQDCGMRCWYTPLTMPFFMKNTLTGGIFCRNWGTSWSDIPILRRKPCSWIPSSP